jgi:hypothetical protein
MRARPTKHRRDTTLPAAAGRRSQLGVADLRSCGTRMRMRMQTRDSRMADV